MDSKLRNGKGGAIKAQDPFWCDMGVGAGPL